MTDLYGLWQTRPWAPPAAVDGRVPRNERGNVEVPPFVKALPAGTVREVAGPGVAVWVGVGGSGGTGGGCRREYVGGWRICRAQHHARLWLPPAPASTLPLLQEASSRCLCKALEGCAPAQPAPPLAAQVHLNYPYLAPVCRKLGVDYAAAMVG